MSKQKIVSLIKKLEILVNNMDAGTSSKSGSTTAKNGDEEAEAEAPKDEEMATTAPAKKSKVVKARGRI